MVTITYKERFDDVGPQDADGRYEYAYRGFEYQIAVDVAVFEVRTYDDEPAVATILKPTTARTSPHARQLVEFIIRTLDCDTVQFYCHAAGTYRPIDLQTLEFIER
jgi:hypothetical protein